MPLPTLALLYTAEDGSLITPPNPVGFGGGGKGSGSGSGSGSSGLGAGSAGGTAGFGGWSGGTTRGGGYSGGLSGLTNGGKSGKGGLGGQPFSSGGTYTGGQLGRGTGLGGSRGGSPSSGQRGWEGGRDAGRSEGGSDGSFTVNGGFRTGQYTIESKVEFLAPDAWRYVGSELAANGKTYTVTVEGPLQAIQRKSTAVIGQIGNDFGNVPATQWVTVHGQGTERGLTEGFDDRAIPKLTQMRITYTSTGENIDFTAQGGFNPSPGGNNPGPFPGSGPTSGPVGIGGRSGFSGGLGSASGIGSSAGLGSSLGNGTSNGAGTGTGNGVGNGVGVGTGNGVGTGTGTGASTGTGTGIGSATSAGASPGGSTSFSNAPSPGPSPSAFSPPPARNPDGSPSKGDSQPKQPEGFKPAPQTKPIGPDTNQQNQIGNAVELAAILALLQSQTSFNNLRNAAQEGACNSAKPGGCTDNAIKRNNQSLLDNLGSKLDAVDLAQNTIMLNRIDSKLGPQINNGGIGGLLQRFTQNHRVTQLMNALTFVTTLHNAYFLSSAISQTLLSTASNVLTIFGVKDENGDPLNLQAMINGTIEDIAEQLLGVETVDGIKESWKKYSRIYQAASNLLFAVQGMFYLVQSGLSVGFGWVARIGNGMKRSGVVREREYPTMDETPNFKSPGFLLQERLQKVSEVASTIDTVSSTVLSVSDTSKQINEAYKGLNKELEEKPKKADESRYISVMKSKGGVITEDSEQSTNED